MEVIYRFSYVIRYKNQLLGFILFKRRYWVLGILKEERKGVEVDLGLKLELLFKLFFNFFVGDWRIYYFL